MYYILKSYQILYLNNNMSYQEFINSYKNLEIRQK